jgi:hypothetical protein
MPVTFEIHEEARLVTLACGNTSLNQWRRVMREVLAHPRFAPGYSFLVDCRTATLVPSTDDVHGVVTFIARQASQLGRGRWAVVAEQPAGYGMARMASALGDAAGVSLKAFRDIEAARAWLG